MQRSAANEHLFSTLEHKTNTWAHWRYCRCGLARRSYREPRYKTLHTALVSVAHHPLAHLIKKIGHLCSVARPRTLHNELSGLGNNLSQFGESRYRYRRILS